MNGSPDATLVSSTFYVAALFASIACSAPDRSASLEPDPDKSDLDTAQLYAPDHWVEVRIEMAPEDWETLRHEGPSFIDARLQLNQGLRYDYDYTYFTAAVSVDGVRHENVAVRKKGSLGSLSTLRPSLRLNLNRLVKDQAHAGVTDFTLNNDVQDPSRTTACLAYALFARAGLPTPRCNHAHVVVNGVDLGTYSNVELVRKPMLSRYFAETGGNLYENGGASDFTEHLVHLIESENSESDTERSDLSRIVKALDAPDDSLVAALAEVIDLENFRDFWAMETLTRHGDGYSSNRNNFYVYHDTRSDHFFFIPSGPDNAFSVSGAFNVDPYVPHPTVYATGRIANRLYALAPERQRYRERLGELNETLWDSSALLAEVDRVERLSVDASASALEQQRLYIQTHQAALRAALAEPAPDVPKLHDPEPGACGLLVSPVEGRFRTSFGKLDEFGARDDEFSLELSLDGNSVEQPWLGKAGNDPLAPGYGVEVRYVTSLPDGTNVGVVLLSNPELFDSKVLEFHGKETFGAVVALAGEGLRVLGLIPEGELVFDQVGQQPGAPVEGSFRGRMLQTSCPN